MQIIKLSNLYLVLFLVVISTVIVGLQHDKYNLMVATDVMNVIIVIPFSIFSITLAIKNRNIGSLGKAWVFFAIFAVSWSAGEIIWALDELVYKNDPFPSSADFFWMVGFPAYFLFAIMYLGPFRDSISKKTTLISASVCAPLMGFLVYCAITKSTFPLFETVLLTAYPIGDVLCLVPTIIGLALFFKGQVSFTWLLLLVGMLCFVVADSGYQILSQSDQYYTGHPIDIAYLWAYAFFVFGAYHHIKIFKSRNQENRFNSQENMR